MKYQQYIPNYKNNNNNYYNYNMPNGAQTVNINQKYNNGNNIIPANFQYNNQNTNIDPYNESNFKIKVDTDDVNIFEKNNNFKK